MRFVVLLFIGLLIKHAASAQEYTVEHFTDENGLPQNSVKSLALDAGFLWLATENGPVRYDGETFLLFDKNLTGAISNRVLDFKKHADGQLYANSERGQLLPISQGGIRRRPVLYDTVFKAPGYGPTEFYEPSGLPNLLEKDFEGMPYFIPDGPDRSYKVFRDTVHIFVKHKEALKFYYPVTSQQRLFLLGGMLYYVDNSRQIHQVSPGAAQVEIRGELLSESQVKGPGKLFWNYSTGQVFLAINNSLYLFKKTGSKHITTERVLTGVNLETEQALVVHYDTDNLKVFVGTSTEGLYIFTRRQFRAIGETNYYAQHPLADNAVLFSNGDILKKNGDLSRMELVEKLGNNYTLLVDRERNIWIRERASVHCLSPDGQKKLFTISLPDYVHVIYQSADNRIWIGTASGVYQVERGPHGKLLITCFSKVPAIVYLQQAGDELWMGTSRGLYRKNIRTKVLTRYGQLHDKQVRTIYIRNHHAWVATYGDGLYLVTGRAVKKVPPDRNNYLNSPHCILEDKKGFFWISTNKGLFKASAQDLIDYTNGKVSTVYYQFYNKDFGFNTNEFNGGCQPCASKLADGRFIYPTIKGAVEFSPAAVRSSFPNKKIFIDKIEVDENSDFDVDRNITLAQGYNKLTIHFSSPYFGSPENLNFAYRLDEDPVWRPTSGQSISYTSLPYGNHSLQIRKLNGFGPNNFTYKIIKITILPYFYETWWFKMLLGIIAIITVYLLILLRTELIRKRNELLEKNISERTNELMLTISAYENAKGLLERQSHFQRRLITAITHDIKSPLKYLMKTGESLYKNNTAGTKNKDGLKAIYDSSFQMFHFTDNLLQYARGFVTQTENVRMSVDLSRLVDDKIAIFHHLAASHQTRIQNEIPPGTLIDTNPPLLAVILHNILDNAVKFTVSGEVIFLCSRRAEWIEIQVKDNGAGLTEEQVAWFNNDQARIGRKNFFETSTNGGLGLAMIKEMAHIIDAEIRVDSKKGLGTCFTVYIEK